MVATLAIDYQGTDEAFALDLPETRIVAALSVEAIKNTLVSFKWAHEEPDGSTGGSANTATVQLIVEL